jgi:hypothetical protein
LDLFENARISLRQHVILAEKMLGTKDPFTELAYEKARVQDKDIEMRENNKRIHLLNFSAIEASVKRSAYSAVFEFTEDKLNLLAAMIPQEFRAATPREEKPSLPDTSNQRSEREQRMSRLHMHLERFQSFV